MRMNLDFVKICASCKYWDDPTRSAIKPTTGRGLWEVDMTKKFLCIRRRVRMMAGHRCPYHESKV